MTTDLETEGFSPTEMMLYREKRMRQVKVLMGMLIFFIFCLDLCTLTVAFHCDSNDTQQDYCRE
jgi:hypothetical protein